MSQTTPEVPARSYGCTFGCGNPYDFIVITVSDGTTEFLCLPCYVKLAMDMVEAVTNPESETVKAAMAEKDSVVFAPFGQSNVKPRGKNAPATTDDEDLIEAFAGVITEDELPDEFR